MRYAIKRPSEAIRGHPEAIQRPSRDNHKRPSRGHPEAIQRSSRGHPEAIKRGHQARPSRGTHHEIGQLGEEHREEGEREAQHA